MEFTGRDYQTAFFMDGFATPSEMPTVSLKVDGNQAELRCRSEHLARFYIGRNMQEILARKRSNDDVALIIFGVSPEELAWFEPSNEMLHAQAEANSFVAGYQPAKDGGKSVTFVVFKGGFGWIKLQPPTSSNFFYLSTPSSVSKLSTARNKAVTVCEGCVTAKDLKPRALCISDDEQAGLLMVAQPIVFDLFDDKIQAINKSTLALLTSEVDKLESTQNSGNWEVLGYFVGKGTSATLLNERSDPSAVSDEDCKM